ncbi:MAG: TonB-dependent receptor [Saprospiraceae bacterium]|nr:TonB-dependent receptor [Saprospiraceae bacterium]
MRKLLILYISFFFFTPIWSQKRPDEKLITYTAVNKPLNIVLKDLAAISNVSLIYSESRIPAAKQISISAKNEKLGDVLNVILDDFKMSYHIVGNQLVLVKISNEDVSGKIRIYGYIRDKQSGEYLIGANVFLHDRSEGTATNEKGFFSFLVKKEALRVHFTYLGYKSEIKDIHSFKDTLLQISLQPDGLLNEIVILDDLLEEEHETTASQQNLHIDKIRSSNHLGGEPDLFRYLGTQAGISSAAEGIGGLNVRGGSSDQNLVLLDGVPIYNTGHALGIFSVFNANAIKSASFYKGSIPARYAGRLSSVIDVHTKDGNFNKFSGDATLSAIAFKGSIEGPIVRDKSSFIVSYRRTYMDIWIKELTQSQLKSNNRTGSANYFFSDFNAKFNFKIGKKTRFHLQTLHSGDNFSFNNQALPSVLRDENDKVLNWGNQLYSARLDHQVSKSLFSTTTAYCTIYDFENYKNSLYESKFNNDTLTYFEASISESNIAENGLKQEVDWLISPSHTVKFGGNLQFRTFSPKITNVTENTFNDTLKSINVNLLRGLFAKPTLKSDEINIFAEDLINLGDGVSMNVGLNYSTIITENSKAYSSFQPRFALLADGDNLHFKIGLSRMQQYIHLLTNGGLGFPSDIWLPSTDKLSPQQAWIFNTSVGYKTNSGLKFGMEVYYKQFDNISSFKEGDNIEVRKDVDWATFVPTGNGNAYGFETYFEKVVGKTLFNVNYTYSISDRRFADLNNGNKFPYALNRNHSVKASFNYRISEFSEFLVNWSYMSGTYYSQPVDVTFNVNGKPVVIFPAKNNAQFPEFHRLDIGFSFYNVYKWGRAKFFLGLYNAYNRKNPFYTELVRTKNEANQFEFKQFTLLPWLPSLSYSISF